MRRFKCRCRLPCETCFGADVDDIFAYSSAKRVSIRDHRLGVLYYTALLGAIVYIGVYTLACTLAYLDFKVPTGTIRLKLQQPTVDGCDPETSTCEDAFPNTADLKYCCAANCTQLPDEVGACRCSFRPAFRNYRCEFLDGDMASQIIGTGTMLIATKNKVSNEYLNTNCTQPGAQDCPKLWTIGSSYSSFVAGIEDFTLLVEHSARVSALNFNRQSRTSPGFLFVPQGGAVQDDLCARRQSYTQPYAGQVTKRSPCYLKPVNPPNTSLDIFTVTELLIAGGLGPEGLDSESFDSSHSIRFEGMVMQMSIRWFNTWPWRGEIPNASYYYAINAMPTTPYSQHDDQWTDNASKRIVNAFHGIMLQASVSGTIGSFSFNNLLIQLAASSALLGVAVLLVDLAAMYCCRNRRYYAAAMVERTADFSEVDRLEGATENQLRDLCRQRHLPVGGGHHAMVCRLLSDDFVQSPGTSFQSLPLPARGGPGSLDTGGDLDIPFVLQR